jgi:hypothetical protein
MHYRDFVRAHTHSRENAKSTMNARMHLFFDRVLYICVSIWNDGHLILLIFSSKYSAACMHAAISSPKTGSNEVRVVY